MRRLLLSVLALFGLIAGLLATASTAGAEHYDKSFTATVTQVLVNAGGGITVSGTVDCSAQVAEIYGEAENIPAGTSVFVGVNWVASQTVGRTKVVSATYEAGIAHLCFTNDPAMSDDLEAPWAWRTLYGFPVGTVQWVYSPTGKFSAGRIHVELSVTGELTTETDVYGLYSQSGWDVRAVKSR